MNDDGNIQAGIVVEPPKGPFWKRAARVWISQAVTALCNAKIVRGTKDSVHISGRNLVIELKDTTTPATDPNPTPAATIAQPFLVKQEFPTYLICHKFVSGIEDGTDIKVYKPIALQNVTGVSTFYGWQFQCTPLQLNIAGVQTTSPSKRRTTLKGISVPALALPYKEVVYPPYSTNATDVMSTIYAIQLPNGDWLDINVDARKWYKEVTTCTTAGTEIALVPSSHVYNTPIDFTKL